jgi:hypothetical protein
MVGRIWVPVAVVPVARGRARRLGAYAPAVETNHDRRRNRSGCLWALVLLLGLWGGGLLVSAASEDVAILMFFAGLVVLAILWASSITSR